MNRWAAAVLAIAVAAQAIALVGCQQTQPAGSPFAAFQPTRLPSPTTGSYGMAKNGTNAASAAGSGGSTVPQTWNGGGASSPTATAPAATSPTTTPAVGGGLGGTSAIPPTLPPSGDSYYNPGTSSTVSGAGAAGLAQLQPLPPGGAVAGVSPSGSFGIGGSFASPGTSYGAPIAGYAPTGGVATVGYDQPIAASGPTAAGMTQPTYFGPSASAASTLSTYGQPTYGAAATQPSLSGSNGTPSNWNGGTSSTSSGDALQWRAR